MKIAEWLLSGIRQFTSICLTKVDLSSLASLNLIFFFGYNDYNIVIFCYNIALYFTISQYIVTLSIVFYNVICIEGGLVLRWLSFVELIK